MQKILIIRFSSIGDLVLTTPVIRALKLQLEEAEIHFLCKKRFVGIMENNPYLTKTHSFDEHLSEILPQLKKEKFDLIIDLHKNFRSFLVKKRLGIKSLSFNKLNIEKWLLVNFKINVLPKTHIVDRYFEGINSLGVTNDRQGLDYFEVSRIKDKSLLSNDTPKKFIVFALAGTYFTKKIPFEKWSEMLSLSPLPIVLLGGDTEKELGERLKREGIKQSILNLCGAISLNESAAYIRKSEMVVTGDTGLMHIAAACQRKVVSLWGNTVPEFGMSPYIPQKTDNIRVIENKNLSCRPCSKLGYSKCPKGHFDCMMKLDLSNVFLQI